MLKRIKFISRHAYPMTRIDIDHLVAQATQANAQRGITSALMVTGELFFQILEGRSPTVDVCFARIKSDSRHRKVHCIAEERSRSRMFPASPMRLVIPERFYPAQAEALERLIEHGSTAALAEVDTILSRVFWAELRHAA